MENISTKNNSEINNVQDFADIIGANDNLWSLLQDKKVSRFDDRVQFKIPHKGRQEIKRTQGKIYTVNIQSTSSILIEIDYGDAFLIGYRKDSFIKEFNRFSPPLLYGQVAELVQIENAARKEAEQRRREAEQRRREAEEWELKRHALLANLKEYLDRDFLAAHTFYRTECVKHISFQEYEAEKTNHIKLWVQQNLGFKPDSEQAIAIGAVEGHVQVLARAGSGKTRTLVSRALFLQKHCGVSPHEMLLLAFNKKAAHEIRDRLTKQLQDSIPYVMTFHALAYALVHPEEDILFNEPDGEQSKSRALQTVIDDYLRAGLFHSKNSFERI